MAPSAWKLIHFAILACIPSALATTFVAKIQPGGTTLLDAVCTKIGKSISSASAVYYPGDALYDKGIFHYAASSTQSSTCVVEAGSPADIGKILGIVGRTKVPFAVKGGGHTINPGFSSTVGVQISMYRFSDIQYNATSSTVEIGAGLIWDDVYAALDPLGVTVLGGRVSGVGVAGFTLGGGYSYKTSQYGLAVDNVIAFELVKPSGDVVIVTKASDPELFFGLKGSQNNFGVVTKFTVKTHPQPQVWGGSITASSSSVSAVTTAALVYQTFNDPKSSLTIGYVYVPSTNDMVVSLVLFYDAPTPPPGLFDAFLAIPALESDISTRNYLDMVLSSPPNINSTEGTRMAYQGLPMISFTADIADLFVNETLFWGEALADKSEIGVSYWAEFFSPDIYSHTADSSAFPPVRSVSFKPYILNYIWDSPVFDADFNKAAIASAAYVRRVAADQGQTDILSAPIYPNYALSGTPLEDMYGSNLPALHALKARVDPKNIMGLAGGWKF